MMVQVMSEMEVERRGEPVKDGTDIGNNNPFSPSPRMSHSASATWDAAAAGGTNSSRNRMNKMFNKGNVPFWKK